MIEVLDSFTQQIFPGKKISLFLQNQIVLGDLDNFIVYLRTLATIKMATDSQI